MKRRSFLKVLGLAPLAGASAAPASAASLAGLDTFSGRPNHASDVDVGALVDEASEPINPKYVFKRKILGGLYREALKTGKLDPVVARKLEWSAKLSNVRSLDPDLACNRSMSLVAKIRLQRDRKVREMLETGAELDTRLLEEIAFEKLHGIRMFDPYE